MKLVLDHVLLKRIIFIFLFCHCHFSACLGSSRFSTVRDQETKLNGTAGRHTNDLVTASGNVSKRTRHRLTSNHVNIWVQLGNDIEGTGQEYGKFGYKVASSGDGSFVIVGTPYIDNDDDSDSSSASSSKKVPQSRLLMANNMTTRKSKKLPKSNKTADASFPRRSLKSDGYASVYHYDDGEWAQFRDDFHGEDENFGEQCGKDVAINKAGDRIFISCPYYGFDGSVYTRRGRVRVYHSVQNQWEQLGQEILGYIQEYLGESLAVSNSGNRMVTGGFAYDTTGMVRIFEYDIDANEWFQLGGNITGDKTSDYFGYSVDMSGDGYDIIVGAPAYDGNAVNTGLVRIYHYDDDKEQWDQVGSDILGFPKDVNIYFGTSVAISADGMRAIVGTEPSYSAEEVLVYGFDDSLAEKWKHVATLTGEGDYDYFGTSLDINDDGDRMIVGAQYNDGNGNSAGHARVYEYNPSNETWNQIGTDLDGDSPGDEYGASVAISGDGKRVVIGGTGKDKNDLNSVGHVRVFASEPPCHDSPLRVLTRKLKKSAKTCSFISNSAAKYCKFKKYQTHCPDACKVCNTFGFSDSIGSFIFQRKVRDCQWLRGLFVSSPSEIIDLCQTDAIRATCRETCGYLCTEM